MMTAGVSPPGTVRADVERLAGASGLILRGGFRAGADDGVPPLGDGSPARAVLLLGNAGGDMWPHFAASAEAGDGEPHPLNRWSRRIIDGIAQKVSAQARYPFEGPPFLPFLRWARRAEPVHPSPMGMLIHPRYGVWHAYRGALLFQGDIEVPVREEAPRPCDTCRERPCLSACPVGAFTGDAYDLDACSGHLLSGVGTECVDGGCLARRACPVGPAWRYAAEHMRFHMHAFTAARAAERGGRKG